MKKIFYLVLFSLLAYSCTKEGTNSGSSAPKKFLTENVVIVVMDGARYSECIGDPTRQYIPRLDSLMKASGVLCDRFYNKGVTNTNSGHTAICTGIYENIENTGKDVPSMPGIFHYYRLHKSILENKTWIITTKDKLEILKHNKNRSKYLLMPSTDCGNAGIGTGYRKDSVTYTRALTIFDQYHPSLVLINFKEPDASGHANNWPGYLQGIKDVDSYAVELWKHIQADTVYKNKTTLIVTNDHGRHLDGHLDGFVSHGDDCDGCRHVNFYVIGPDFKKGVIVSTEYEMRDISKTVGDLLNFPTPYSEGRVMKDLYK